jgi:hypothetical protein
MRILNGLPLLLAATAFAQTAPPLPPEPPEPAIAPGPVKRLRPPLPPGPPGPAKALAPFKLFAPEPPLPPEPPFPPEPPEPPMPAGHPFAGAHAFTWQARPGESSSDIEEDLKILALTGLVQSDPDRAAPLVEAIVKSSPSRRLRERALQLAARSETQRGQNLLAQVARGQIGGTELQVRAIRYLGGSHALLTEIYQSSADMAVKRAVADALASQENAPALVALARKETDPATRRELVRRLSRMRSKEANDYMAELLK